MYISEMNIISSYRVIEQVRSLDGLWDFAVSPTGNFFKGYRENWFNDSLSKVKY